MRADVPAPRVKDCGAAVNCWSDAECPASKVELQHQLQLAVVDLRDSGNDLHGRGDRYCRRAESTTIAAAQATSAVVHEHCPYIVNLSPARKRRATMRVPMTSSAFDPSALSSAPYTDQPLPWRVRDSCTSE